MSPTVIATSSRGPGSADLTGTMAPSSPIYAPALENTSDHLQVFSSAAVVAKTLGTRDTTAPLTVAVVIPFFRSDATIGRALASVASQTYPVAQVIVVDDASGGASASFAQALTGHWQSLTLEVMQLEANSGAASARNAGWDKSVCDLVAFLDSDDAWHPRKIEMQVEYMRAHPEVDACGHGHSVAPASQPGPDARPIALAPGALRINSFRILLFNRFVTPSVMVRRSVKLRFDAGQRHMEDHLLWMRMVLGGAHVTRLDMSLVTLFKPSIGAGGLSGDVMKMQSADMRNYLKLWRDGLLGSGATAFWIVWSSMKFVRRLALLAIRRSARAARP